MLVINWLIEHWIENVAVVTGLLYIILSIRQNIWCWLFGIISSVAYLWVFFNYKIYADMSLQLYYVIMGVYGWMHWAGLDQGKQDKESLKISRLNLKSALVLLAISIALFFIIVLILINFTDSPVPYVDAFTTSLSFVATWMLARKILEHWMIWIIVDAVSIGLYFYRELYASIILFAVFTLLAVVGFIEWKKECAKA